MSVAAVNVLGLMQRSNRPKTMRIWSTKQNNNTKNHDTGKLTTRLGLAFLFNQYFINILYLQ